MKLQHIMLQALLIVALLAISTSCIFKYPRKVANVINKSKNRTELESTIEHYKSSDEPLKLEAAYFLIGNMDDKYGLSHTYKNSAGISGFHYYLDASNYSNLQQTIDSLTTNGSNYQWSYEGNYDKNIITSANLIETIDYSFKVWREMPWAAKLTFPEFCEYVLPYRVSNEPFSNWRKHLYEKYKWVVDSVKDKTDPVEACTLINKELSKWLLFHGPLNLSQGKRSVLETESYKKGTCVDISNYATSVMRALGIPVAIDFTPAWADRANGHNWNVVFSATGEAIRFNAADLNALPGSYAITAKMAKIFRYTYQNQEDALPQIIQNGSKYNDIKIPPQLNYKNVIDVTESYNKVTNCEIKLNDATNKHDIAFLSVYNHENWKPLGWSFINDNTLTFNNIGVDILYLLTFNSSTSNSLDSIPIIITEDNKIQELLCNKDSLIKLTANFHNIVKVYEYLSYQGIEKNKEYILYYWDKKWIQHSIIKADMNQISYKKVPTNTLYKIQCIGITSSYTRPFSLRHGIQVFW